MYRDRLEEFFSDAELQDITDETSETVLDLGVPERGGEVYPFSVYVSTGSETTATGDPDIDISLESANTPEFDDEVREHVLFKGLKKAQLNTGKALTCPMPWGMLRYARMKITAESAIACTTLTAGLTFNPQQNNNRTVIV